MNEMTPAARGRWAAAMLVFGGLFVGQAALFVFRYNSAGITSLLVAGWALLGISVVLMTLARQASMTGDDAAEDSGNWLDTAHLIDKGIYAVIRHPLFLSFILLVIALMLLSQHWLSVAFGLPIVAFVYAGMHVEERHNVAKFGEAYARYMARVPRINLVLGVIRLLRRRNGTRKNTD